MNRFKHGILFADIRTACRADAALEFRRFVGDDVAVEVRKNKNFEVFSAFGVNKFCGRDVDVPFIGGYLGIFFAYLAANVEEFAVGGLDDIRFLYY